MPASRHGMVNKCSLARLDNLGETDPGISNPMIEDYVIIHSYLNLFIVKIGLYMDVKNCISICLLRQRTTPEKKQTNESGRVHISTNLLVHLPTFVAMLVCRRPAILI